MPILFYNSITRRKEQFIPLKPGHVGIYTCGPTVYSAAHVGNFRTFVFEDLLKRYLLFKGYKVTHVMNLTDVDDKTIREASTSGKSLNDFTDKYIRLFNIDSQTLKILPADHYPRATEHITEMIAMIQKLMDRGFAYKAQDNSIYFAINSFADYGKLTRLNMAQMQSTERIETDEYSKDNPQDFSLWKAWKSQDGAVGWESPWGRGRPGWHIECSAMSMAYLGEHFDIHCGGVDNLFPHHENEIAQSVCATDGDFVNYWLHSEHLLLERDKMSKSMGNFYRVSELLETGFTPESLRFVLLSTHYRSKLKFSINKRHEAGKAIRRIQDIHDRLTTFSESQTRAVGEFERLPELLRFEEMLDNDLDISGALGVFFEWIRRTNTRLNRGELTTDDAITGLNFIKEVNSILDILPSATTIPDEINQLVLERDSARKNHDWKKSDKLRDKLRSMGWVTEDNPNGTKVKPIL